VITVLNEFKEKAGFGGDEVVDLSRVAGEIHRNKTGDVLVEVDGDPERSIAIEVKLDKGVKLGQILDRDPVVIVTSQSPTIGLGVIEYKARRRHEMTGVWVKHSPIIFQVLKETTGRVVNDGFIKLKNRCRVIE